MSGTNNSFDYRPFVAPKYWPTWFGFGLLRLSILLPYPVLILLADMLGSLGYALMPARRRITRANLRACFPDRSARQIRRLSRQSFCSATASIFESALAWWASDARLKKLYRIEGLENVQLAQEQGKGILLLGGHYTTLEISGRLLAYHLDVYPTYKPAHNKLFEAVMTHARRHANKGLLESRDMRGIIRCLKQNQTVWYAQDQDFGHYSSVFAPFMGVPASTLTLTSRLARTSKAPVLPFYSERLPGGQGYLLRIGKPLADFPSGDDVRDATAVNQAIEEQVRRTPEQYLWGHRRFKTQPKGMPQLYRPRRDKRLRRYSRLLGLLAIPAVFYTGWQAWKARSGPYFRERLGLGQFPSGPFDIWLHAASVGEVNAVIPLIKLMRARYPQLRLLLSVNTPSGQATAIKALPADIPCHFLPIDWQFAVERFIRQIRPRCALIVETEIWPNLYLHTHYLGIPTLIINGRLSAKTFEAPEIIRGPLSRTMESIYMVLARSEEDGERFIRMGLDDRNLRIMGNLKFASEAGPQAVTAFATDQPYVLAASTRPGEEKYIVQCWQKLALDEHLLIIVPRHPRRKEEILADLASLGNPPRVRSQGEQPDADSRIYLADTFGELPAFIKGSELVIMGGSLQDFGGQNIIEVARLGKAVIFGPHMDNFKQEAELFIEHEAGMQVKDQGRLCQAIAELLSDPARAQQMGINGQQLIEQMSHVHEQYLAELERQLPTVFHSSPERE